MLFPEPLDPTSAVVVCTCVSSRLVLGPLREHQLLSLLDAIGLDDADTAQGLPKSARHLRVDLPAFAEQRPQPLEHGGHHQTEQDQNDQGDHRQPPVQIKQHRHADGRGYEAAHQLREPGAHQIANALGVGHDAGDQDAAFGRIEVADRQSGHVALDPLPHLGDGTLCRDAEDLRQREPGAGLHQRGHRRPAGRGD